MTPAILARLGGPTDGFVVRFLALERWRQLAECARRATGAWACNDADGYAMWLALADELSGTPPRPPGWGSPEYSRYRAR